MPTSSQALLLMNTGSSNPNLDKLQVVTKKSSILACSQRELTPCPVSHVDINELWKSAGLDRGEHLIVEDLTKLNERDASTIQSELDIKGYHTVLSYNKSSGTFAWKFNDSEPKDETEAADDSGFAPPTPKIRPKTSVATRRTASNIEEKPPRPQTADMSSRRPSVTFAKPLYYNVSNKGERLVCFGLSMPVGNGTSLGEKCSKSILKKHKSSEETSKLKNAVSFSSRSLESGGDGAISVRMKSFKGTTVVNKPSRTSSSGQDIRILLSKNRRQHEKQIQGLETRKAKDSATYDPSYANRVLPSMYMRSKAPDAGPLDVCFSLSHNDRVSHEDLRDSIWRQTGVFPVEMRYEALAIRVGDIGIRNRWIVTAGSQKDADQLINTGLFIDDHNIVVTSLKEIMEREFRTFQFLSKTQAEHTAARIGRNMFTKFKANKK